MLFVEKKGKLISLNDTDDNLHGVAVIIQTDDGVIIDAVTSKEVLENFQY